MAERRTAAEALFTEKERAQVTLNSIGDAVLSTDMDGNVTYLNVVAERMTGWNRRRRWAGRSLRYLISSMARRENPVRTLLKTAIEENRTVGLIRSLHPYSTRRS